MDPNSLLPICFAHSGYKFGAAFSARSDARPFIEVRDLDALRRAIPEAGTLVVSGLWRNDLLEVAPRLKLIQSVSAGIDQYDRAMIGGHGVKLASAQGVNEVAVSEHAIGILLNLTRQFHLLRDRQARREWRPFISDVPRREEELDGKHLVVVGLGRIGARIARLASAFGMRVTGVRRRAASADDAIQIAHPDRLSELLPDADAVILACSLTPETRGLMGAREFAALKSGTYLVSVARGPVVVTSALIDALAAGRLAGAALDCFDEEPLPPSSPLWTMPNVIVTPHSAGETRIYEQRIVDYLVENLARLQAGRPLLNEIV